MTGFRINDEFSDKYLTVRLAGEYCGLGVLSIRELLQLRPITPLPDVPSYVRGYIRLHDRPVPVIDLLARFGFSTERTSPPCLVIVSLPISPDSTLELGLIVDGVGDVISVSAARTASPPATGSFRTGDCARNCVIVGDHPITLLELDRIIDRELAHALAHAPLPVHSIAPHS